MLVVNANQTNDWVFRVSNQFTSITYPDFDMLLCQPLIWDTNHSSIPTAFTVNWTAVNFLNNKLYSPYCFWINGSIWGQNRLHSNTTSSDFTDSNVYTFITQVSDKLKWGEIIGKFVSYYLYNAVYTQKAVELHTTIQVWLLHEDGSITYWVADNRTITNSQNSYQKRGEQASNIFSYSDTWLTAVEWDMVIVKISYSTPSSSRGFWIGFWNSWGTMQQGVRLAELTGGPAPIQISIE